VYCNMSHRLLPIRPIVMLWRGSVKTWQLVYTPAHMDAAIIEGDDG